MSQKIRNIAVIAHVDHGKTTLVDALLKQSHVFRENEVQMEQTQIMDQNELERERGITILAKNCAIAYKDTKINIIDTPGHADFSGEVERTLGMADGALLIVDAQEGPMPQTRFVLKKALEMGLKIIVVINKIDKRFAKPADTLQKIETLFLELAKNEEQLNFPVLYAIGARGVVFKQMPDNLESPGSIEPLLDTVLEFIPEAPQNDGPFKMVVSSFENDLHIGRIVVGKIYQGKINLGDKVTIATNPTKNFKVEKLLTFKGLKRVEIESAESGEIVLIAGIPSAKIGETITDPADLAPLPSVAISEPTLHMTIGPNTSPFAGKEGKFVTSRQIEERLDRELATNLSLRVKKLGNGKFEVSGKGELHLSVLLETMRREGYEMEVGKPEVVIKEIEGQKMEPVEEVSIIVPNEYIGVITEEFGKRFASAQKMDPISEVETEFTFIVPTRSLIGLRSFLLTATKGTLIFSSVLVGYEKVGKSLPKLRRGAIISDKTGEAQAYGLDNAQNRGLTFIEPAERVYEGMIIGLNAKDDDIAMNVCKGKKLTNMRSKSSDGVIQLTPATRYSLEQSLDFLERDELLEITPNALRLRKKYLTDLERKRFASQSSL